MARTNQHRSQKRQHIGQDLWSRRPCSGWAYSAYSKYHCRRLERARGKAQTRQESQAHDR